MRHLLSAAALLFFVLTAPLAHANLVINGDFEAAPDHTLGWTFFSPDGLSLFDTDYSDPGSTNYVFHDGSYTGLGTLSQALGTVTGSKYTLKFDLLISHDATLGELDNRFILYFGDALLEDKSDVVHGWQTFTFTDLVAGADSTLLRFANMNLTLYNQLDNISVVLQDPDDPGVPEPASVLLVLGGALALAAARRRPRI